MNEKKTDVQPTAGNNDPQFYEFLCLETIFQSVIYTLDQELEQICHPIQELVSKFMHTPPSTMESKLDSEWAVAKHLMKFIAGSNEFSKNTEEVFDVRRDLVELYHYSTKLGDFEVKLSNLKDVLGDILDCDEDLENMVRRFSAFLMN